MSARERIDPREVIDDLTMMLTTPLLAGLDATSRLDLVEMEESDLWAPVRWEPAITDQGRAGILECELRLSGAHL